MSLTWNPSITEAYKERNKSAKFAIVSWMRKPTLVHQSGLPYLHTVFKINSCAWAPICRGLEQTNQIYIFYNHEHKSSIRQLYPWKQNHTWTKKNKFSHDLVNEFSARYKYRLSFHILINKISSDNRKLGGRSEVLLI